MPISLDIASLGSRIERQVLGNSGIRSFISSAEGLATSTNNGFFSSILRFAASLLIDTFKILFSGISITWTTIWNLTVNAVGFIYNFNWNITDQEIAAEMVNAAKGITYQLSYVAGSAFGYAVCGALPGLLIATFNEPLAVEIYEKVGETALANLAGQLAAIVQQTGQALGQAAFAFVFKHPKVFLDPIGQLSAFGKVVSGVIDHNHLKKAEEQKKKPWSFAIAVNHKTDSIPSEYVKTLVQQFGAGAGQACVEAGYIVAGTIDSFYTAQKQGNQHILGNAAAVQINTAPHVPGASPTIVSH